MKMKTKSIVFFILCVFSLQSLLPSCNENMGKSNGNNPTGLDYDLRKDLSPSRLTIAMWDYSWFKCHYPGGPFENFDKVILELKERGFNTVRIDCLPHIIGSLHGLDDSITVPANPMGNWGPSDRDRQHLPVKELIGFMTASKQAGLYVILSTWNLTCPEYPDIKERMATDRELYRRNWERTLDILAEHGLLGHVLYVDLDQEFPYFSPYLDELNSLAVGKKGPDSIGEAMEQVGQFEQGLARMAWNPAQLEYVRKLFLEMVPHFQGRYPYLRFTYSLTGFFKEVRSLGLQIFDVLEVHCWIHGPRFDNRTGFNQLKKDRGDHDYKDYQKRVDATMKMMRPMLMQEMRNRMAFLCDWGREIAAPVVTTEAWGPWWHMDHPDLDWDFLRDWCAECMGIAGGYGFWGATPWNFAHPYWDNWPDVEWYRLVNGAFADRE
jgi:hypothetical protein